MVEGGGELMPLHLKSLSSARQLGRSGEGMRDCLMVGVEMWPKGGDVSTETGKHITGGEGVISGGVVGDGDGMRWWGNVGERPRYRLGRVGLLCCPGWSRILL